MTADRPRIVSVIVPCRNERAHIEAFVAGIVGQALPAGWTLEAIVADGASDDGTRALLDRAAAADARVRCIDNPERIVSTGLNRALAVARGEAIVRMDVHTRYAPDYVAACLGVLARTGADNVGGPWRAVVAADAPPMQRAIAAAFQSRWVAGGALSRRLDHDGPADTVYLGAWPRRTFDRFGGFDEALVRNQDDEHNLRIVRGGGTVWQSPGIRSAYAPRSRLAQVFRQYLQYGYWKPFVMRKHGQAARWRQLAPLALVVALIGAAIVAATPAGGMPLAAVALLYAIAVAAMSVAVALERRASDEPAPAVGGASADVSAVALDRGGADVSGAAPDARDGSAGSGPPPTLDFAVRWRLPLVIVTYHWAYGLGSLAGWLDVLRGRRGRAWFGMLSR